MPIIIHSRNPLDIGRNRTIDRPSCPMSPRQWMQTRGIEEFELPTVCIVNGRPVPRKEWGVPMGEGDLCLFVSLPRGGGNGQSNPLLIVGLLAITILSFGAGAIASTALAGVVAATTATTIGSIVSGIVFAAGSFLLNTLVGTPSGPSSLSGPAPSPTYSIGAQSNTARLQQPIPVQYGKHLIYPDLAATPYTEFDGNDQFLFELFCLGVGEFEVNLIRIDDTDIDSYQDVSYEIVPPSGVVTLFPAITFPSSQVSGFILTNAWTTPFASNPASTTISKIAVDIVFPGGLYLIDPNNGSHTPHLVIVKAEARQIDDTGAPVGAGTWTEIINKTIQGLYEETYRISLSAIVAAGRYEVRMERTNPEAPPGSGVDRVVWNGLRGYAADQTHDYGNVTLLAVKIKASDQLSGASSQQVNVIATRKVRKWADGTGWTAPQETSSIVWALADVVTASYGGNQSGNRLDLPALNNLDGVLTARGDEFNARFDQKITIMEAVTKIARCGRCIPYIQGGVLFVVRDEPQTIARGMYTPANMIEGSLNMNFAMHSSESPDSVEVQYIDNQTWLPETVIADNGSQNNPQRFWLFGCTDRAQAWREGMYMVGADLYRRRHVTFRTGLEGHIHTLGDRIAVSHDAVQWGQWGVVYYHNAGSLTLSEAVDFEGQTSGKLILRDITGGPTAELTVSATADPYIVTTTDTIPQTIIDAIAAPETPQRIAFSFGALKPVTQYCRLLALQPRSEDEVEIAAVVEDDRVHTMDTGTPPV